MALLAFPAVEVILYEGSDQWLLRLVMIIFVVLVAIAVTFLRRLPRGTATYVGWVAMLVTALVGLVLPTWAFLAVRPAVTRLFSEAVGVGPGVWLNGIGHLLVAVLAITWLAEQRSANESG